MPMYERSESEKIDYYRFLRETGKTHEEAQKCAHIEVNLPIICRKTAKFAIKDRVRWNRNPTALNGYLIDSKLDATVIGIFTGTLVEIRFDFITETFILREDLLDLIN